jgi:hypothetical protein
VRTLGRRSRGGLAATAAALAVVGFGCAGREPPPREREAKAELSLSPPRAKVGEPVELAVSVEHPEGTEALFPPAGASLGGLEVVEAGEVASRALGPGWRETRRTLLLRGFRPGGYTVGPLEIRLEGEASREISTPKARLEVYSTAPEGASLDDLKDVKGPFELAPRPARWGAWVAVAVGVLAALAGAALAAKRLHARREERRRNPPPPPAHETALAELKKIRESGLLESGRAAEYTDKVSDVLRRYLQGRFDLPAPERTTEEFLDEVARAAVIDRARRRFLADYLARCDLVKFAAQDPGRRELEGIFDSSVRFVEETADGP